MDTVTTTNNSPAIHGRLDLPIRLPVLLPLLASLIITGCAAPMDARKDAQYQSNASVADRPTSRPTRSLSSMSPSLMCMDHMFRQADLPTTLITSKQIPDVTGKIAVATKDMIVTALSQMSRLSNAFRYIDYEVDISRQDTVQNMTAIMLNNNQMQLQKPALYVSGAVSFVDQNIISNHFEAGTSATRLETGYSTNKNATLIGLDLHMGDFKTRTIIPGLDSANEVVIGNASQGLDLAGKIGSYGVQFNVGLGSRAGAGITVPRDALSAAGAGSLSGGESLPGTGIRAELRRNVRCGLWVVRIRALAAEIPPGRRREAESADGAVDADLAGGVLYGSVGTSGECCPRRRSRLRRGDRLGERHAGRRLGADEAAAEFSAGDFAQ